MFILKCFIGLHEWVYESRYFTTIIFEPSEYIPYRRSSGIFQVW